MDHICSSFWTEKKLLLQEVHLIPSQIFILCAYYVWNSFHYNVFTLYQQYAQERQDSISVMHFV